MSTKGLWARFHVLRVAILSYLSDGVPETDNRIVQARHQQRMIAEKIVKSGGASGIAFAREGDLSHAKDHAKSFQRKDDEKNRGQVVGLKSLRFFSEAKGIQDPQPEKSELGFIGQLLREGKTSSGLGRELSHMEGSMGVDYVIDNDPESGIDFYVPI